jgi:hypothetical protein
VRGARPITGALGALGLTWGLAYVTLSARPAPTVDDWQARLDPERPAAAISGPPQFSMDPPPAYTRTPLSGTPRSRKVLVLYNSHEQFTEEDDHGKQWKVPTNTENNRFHTLAELALNHAGLVTEFADLNNPQGLPDAAAMADFRGVAVWTNGDRCRDPEGTLRWYAEQGRAGRRVVFLERTGCAKDLKGRAISPEVWQSSLAELGLRLGDTEIWDADQISVEFESGKRTGFEQKLDLRLPYWRDVQALDPEARVWLRLGLESRPGAAADAVIVGPRASFVMREYAFREHKVGARWTRAWLIDPFALFEAAFGLQDEPRLDFTTLNGLRMFYAHIDGDGMETISEIDRKSMCGEIVRESLLKVYPLPVTLSVVTGRVQPPPEAYGSERAVEVARSLLALPNVEVASHGFSHPMDWRAGEKSELSVKNLPGYTLSGEGEIAHSTAYINAALTTPDKPVRVMLWTGWCNPDEAQLEVVSRLGLYNLNGGDPRMDRLYPSYAHMAPPIHRVGKQFQFYTSAANDYILTDEWQPPYYRFGNVVDTFERTGRPRRVVPANIYYHFYIGQNLSALEGSTRPYDWAMRNAVAPVFVSEYVDVVRDFHFGRVAALGPGRWRVRTDGRLQTVRFDGEPVHLDLEASRGVIGYVHEPDLATTYVHLLGHESVIVRSEAPPQRPYVRRATHRITRAEVRGRRLSVDLGGYGPKFLEVAGLPPERPVEVTIYRGPTVLDEPGLAADGNGVVRIDLPVAGTYTIDVGRP